MILLFKYLAPLLNDALMTSRRMQFTFGDKSWTRVPVTEKESMQEGKMSIGPRMKYGNANLNSFCAQTDGWVCIFNLSFISVCTCPPFKFVSFHLFYILLSKVEYANPFVCLRANPLRFVCPYFILGPFLFFPSRILSFLVTDRALLSCR